MPRSSSAPPASSGLYSRPSGLNGMYCPWSATTVASVTQHAVLEQLTHDVGSRQVSASTSPRATKTPAALPASMTSRASAALRVNAFSTSTCLPAAMASSALAWCSECGVAT